MSAILTESSQGWLWSAGALIMAVLVALIAHRLAFAAAARYAARTASAIDNALVERARRPGAVLAVLAAVLLMLEPLAIDGALRPVVHRIVILGLTGAIGWLIISLSGVVDVYLAARYDLTARDNLQARQVHTQVRMLRRIFVASVVVVTACAMLMAFPAARQVGISLFASAGIAGLVIGIAARPALSNIIAGVQLALTQPIRVDDVVIVEGEWGWIEEIRSTFVVVRIWDLRRLVVPLSYFIEQPFQNWTRQTADILGTVFFYVDYTISVDEVRHELHRILQASDRWDGKVWGLQVTNAREQTMELRALMSAADSGTAWDLRCHVREELSRYVQQRFPQALPKTRAELIRSDEPQPQAA